MDKNFFQPQDMGGGAFNQTTKYPDPTQIASPTGIAPPTGLAISPKGGSIQFTDAVRVTPSGTGSIYTVSVNNTGGLTALTVLLGDFYGFVQLANNIATPSYHLNADSKIGGTWGQNSVKVFSQFTGNHFLMIGGIKCDSANGSSLVPGVVTYETNYTKKAGSETKNLVSMKTAYQFNPDIQETGGELYPISDMNAILLTCGIDDVATFSWTIWASDAAGSFTRN